METARIVSSPGFRFSGNGDGGRLLLRRRGNSQVFFPGRDNTLFLRSEFSDSGHTQYYEPPVTVSGKKQKEKTKEIKTEKKKTKMKLIKRLTKDLDLFSQSAQAEEIGSHMMISEAREALLAELENLRTAEKEEKRKRKEERGKRKEEKAKLVKSKCELSSSSSSSESSDSDGGKVVNLRSLRLNSQPQNESEPMRLAETGAEAQTTCSFNSFNRNDNEISSVSAEAAVSNGKIEICMGGKCRKSGAPMLMEEFERKVGAEGVVVACKCMGKCKTAPNVKVSTEGNVLESSSNPLYIGVGLEDVGAIVANLLGNTRIDDCLLPAS